MIKRPVTRVLLAVVLILSATVAMAQQTSYPLSVTDDSGASLVLKAQPRRIVSLTLFTDEILLALMPQTRLLGVTTYAVDPAVSSVSTQAAAIPNKLGLNVETIVALNPDLVLVASWTDAGPVKQLRDAGIPVYLIASPVSVKEIGQKILRLGLLTGDQGKAQAIVDGMNARIAAVTQRVSKIPADKRLTVLDYTPWGAAQGVGSSWDDVIRLAGLRNGAAAVTSDALGQVPMSQEGILQINPDLLVLPGWIYNDPNGPTAFYKQVVDNPALRIVSAVKNNRVVTMPEFLRSSVSQYIAASVEWLAKTAYPQVFP